jgi:hypothetical protein
MRFPKWATPSDDMNDEELRFAIEAEGIIDFMRRGFTREQHVACYIESRQEQAGKDWDEVLARYAQKRSTRKKP